MFRVLSSQVRMIDPDTSALRFLQCWEQVRSGLRQYSLWLPDQLLFEAGKARKDNEIVPRRGMRPFLITRDECCCVRLVFGSVWD